MPKSGSLKWQHEQPTGRLLEKEVVKLPRQAKRSLRASRATLQDASSAGVSKSQVDATQTDAEAATSGVLMHQLEFSLGGYKPKEVSIKVDDQMLYVHAKHEHKKDTKHFCRELKRERLLPPNVDPDLLRASLNKDGKLTVYAFTYN